jgi:hypothetical protein
MMKKAGTRPPEEPSMTRRTLQVGDVVHAIYARMLAVHGDPELAALATSTLIQDWASQARTGPKRTPARDAA